MDTIPPAIATAVHDRVSQRALEPHVKGITSLPPGAVVGDLPGAGLGIGDGLVSPVAVIRRSALDHNIDVMAEYCRRHDVLLAPHGKTTMAPQILATQLARGAWGVTVGSPVQARTLASFRFPRLLVAHEVVGPAGIEVLTRLLEDNPSLELMVLVDSVAGAKALGDGLASSGVARQLDVLVEVGVPGGRTGCRTAEEVVSVAHAVVSSPYLRLIGVEGYEGVIDRGNVEATLAAVDAYLDSMVEHLRRLREADLVGKTPVLSAGGSIWFDRVVDRFAGAGAQVVLRSGCYVVHDHGRYRRMSPLDGRSIGDRRLVPAMEVWATVVSRPEMGLAVVDAGRRDVSFDSGLPVAVRQWVAKTGEVRRLPEWYEVVRLMDQHAMIAMPGKAPISVGDQLALGISHPCTTFDKWPVIPVLDDHDRVIDAVVTYF